MHICCLGTLTRQWRLHPEKRVSTKFSSPVAEAAPFSELASIVETTCATTSLAPQLIGVLTGKGISGVVIDKMSNDGPTSGERNGEVTRFNWIPYSTPSGGAL